MLSGPHQKFCEGIVAGLTRTAAYAAAYPRANRACARANGSKLFFEPVIQAEIGRLRARAETLAGSALLSLVERRNFLARLVRSRPGQADDDSDLCKDVKSARNRVGVRLRDKLLAIKLDHDLAGPSKDEAPTAESEVIASIHDLVHRIRTSPYLPDGTLRRLHGPQEAGVDANPQPIDNAPQ